MFPRSRRSSIGFFLIISFRNTLKECLNHTKLRNLEIGNFLLENIDDQLIMTNIINFVSIYLRYGTYESSMEVNQKILGNKEVNPIITRLSRSNLTILKLSIKRF